VASTRARKPSNEAREVFEDLKRAYSRLEDTVAALNQTDASDQILSDKRYAENQKAANAVRDQWTRMKQALVGLRSAETRFMFHELDQLNVGSTELQAVKGAIAIIENIFGAAPSIDPKLAEKRNDLVTRFRETGGRVKEIYSGAGVDKSDYYKWLNADPKFPPTSKVSKGIERFLNDALAATASH
jgi:hypothetical protein